MNNQSCFARRWLVAGIAGAGLIVAGRESSSSRPSGGANVSTLNYSPIVERINVQQDAKFKSPVTLSPRSLTSQVRFSSGLSINSKRGLLRLADDAESRLERQRRRHRLRVGLSPPGRPTRRGARALALPLPRSAHRAGPLHASGSAEVCGRE